MLEQKSTDHTLESEDASEEQEKFSGYRPRMNAELKDYVSKCSICQTYQPEHAQCREKLQPHEMPSRPWSTIRADLFEFGHHQYFLTMVDYWLSYFEVQELKRLT